MIQDYADAYENMSDPAAKKLLEESLAIDEVGLKLRQAYLPKFRQVLPEVKVARYFQLENKIQAALYYGLAAEIPLVKSGK